MSGYVDDGDEYTVHLVVKAQHTRGAEPEWEDVAIAVANELEGSTIEVGPAKVLVDSAQIDAGRG